MKMATLNYKTKSNLNNSGNGSSNSTTNAGRDSDYTDLTLEEGIEEFLYIKANVKDLTEKTIETYEYTFDDFQDFLDREWRVSSFGKNIFRRYMIHLKDRELSKSTRALHYRNLRALFNWLVSEDYIDSNPLDDINEPETPDKFPKRITPEQTQKLLKTAKSNKGDWIGHRDYTIVLLFIEAGLRLNELVSAEVEDLNLKRHILNVVGKGNKERNVAFGAKTYKALRKWLDRREELDKIYDDNIFLTRNGEEMSKKNVQDRITKLQNEAGLEDVEVHPHVLRHTSATLQASKGMDTANLTQMYGWSLLDTADQYIHMSGRDTREAVKQSSPIDNMDFNI